MENAYETWYEGVEKSYNSTRDDIIFQLPSDKLPLSRNIAVTLYAISEKKLGDLVDKLLSATEQPRETIDNVEYDVMVIVHVAYVYAFKNKDNTFKVPLIIFVTVAADQKFNIRFVDHFGTVYNTWEEFLDKNIWRGWRVIFPEQCDVADILETIFKDDLQQGIDGVKKIWKNVSTVCEFSATLLSFFPELARARNLLKYIGSVLGGSSANIKVRTDESKLLKKCIIVPKLSSSEKAVTLGGLFENVLQMMSLKNYASPGSLRKTRLCLQGVALFFLGRSMKSSIADWKKLSYLSKFFLSMVVFLFSLTTRRPRRSARVRRRVRMRPRRRLRGCVSTGRGIGSNHFFNNKNLYLSKNKKYKN